MGINDARHVRHAVVANLDIVPIKDFVKLMLREEVFIEKVEKFIDYRFVWTFWLYMGD